MQYRHYDEGEILCSEGDAAEEFFVVVKGSCDVTVGVNAGAPTRVGHLGVLTCFGEAALAVESEERAEAARRARPWLSTVTSRAGTRVRKA